MTVRLTKLDSGLTVATDQMATVETVSLGAWVGVGARHEAPDVNGVSHLLEHMAFKGTKRRSAYDIAAEIEAVGGHLNAYTSRENTAFYAKVLAEHAPLALDIIADILQHPTFDPDELVRERSVVLQEIGQSIDTPDDVIFDYFQSTAFPGQSIGRPVLGSVESVRALDREALYAHLTRYYAAPRMLVVAAGKIDHDELVERVARAFGELPEAPDGASDPARYGGGDYRQERDLEQVHILLGFRGLRHRDPEYYAITLLAILLGGGMSSRLFQEVREKRGLVYAIHAFHSAFTDDGLFGIYAGTGEGEIAELVPLVCDELVKLTDGIADDEIARAKAQLKASILMSRESSGARCEQLAQQILFHGGPLSVERIVAEIEAVDAARLRDAAARLLASRPTVTALGPIAKLESFERIADRLA